MTSGEQADWWRGRDLHADPTSCHVLPQNGEHTFVTFPATGGSIQDWVKNNEDVDISKSKALKKKKKYSQFVYKAYNLKQLKISC